MDIRRKGGVLPLGDGRIGVPIEGDPDPDWIKAVSQAMLTQQPGDERWTHAAATVTVDNVDGVRHLSMITSGIEPADFLITYMQAIDAAIATANEA